VVRWLLLPLLAALSFLINAYAPYRGHFGEPPHPWAWGTVVAAILLGLALAALLRRVLPRNQMPLGLYADIASVALGAMLAYELSTNRLGLLVSPIFPSLNMVFYAFVEDFGLLIVDCTASSLQLAMTGFFGGLLAAIPLGILLGWSKYLMRVMNPFVRIVNAVPVPAWIPVLIVGLPTLFLSMSALLFIGTFFPVLNATVFGIRGVDRRFVEAGEMLGARRWQIMLRIAIPSALPNIFAGILSAWIIMFMLLIIAEMIGASSGIGWYLTFVRGWGEYNKVIAAMLWSGLLGLAGFEAIRRVEGRLLRWRVGLLR